MADMRIRHHVAHVLSGKDRRERAARLAGVPDELRATVEREVRWTWELDQARKRNARQ